MVVVADKILRIIGPTGRPSITAALSKLVVRERALEGQLREEKSAARPDDAAAQAEIRAKEDALREVRKKIEALKAQMAELDAQEKKEARAAQAVREVQAKTGIF